MLWFYLKKPPHHQILSAFMHTFSCGLMWNSIHYGNLVTCIDRTLIFGWHVVKCDSNKWTPKKTCAQFNSALHARNMITISCSIVNIIVGTYITIKWLQEYLLSWLRYSYKLPRLWGNWLWPQFVFANQLILIISFISYEKWVYYNKLPFNTHLPSVYPT